MDEAKCHHVAAGIATVPIDKKISRGSLGVKIDPVLCDKPTITLTAESLDVTALTVEAFGNCAFLIKVLINPRARMKTAVVHWQAIAVTQ